jgi:hypothetical protein
VEVCDPSEAPNFGYSVNNLLVSDFYTPHFFDPVQSAGVRYSFTGAITEPRQVLKGGYLSWQDPISKHFYQERWFNTAQPEFEDLGMPNATMAPREFVDRQTDRFTEEALKPGRKAAAMASDLTAEEHDRATAAQAEAWQKLLDDVLGSDKDEAPRGEERGPPTVRRAPRARGGKG